jgi:hypothetical protein
MRTPFVAVLLAASFLVVPACSDDPPAEGGGGLGGDASATTQPDGSDGDDANAAADAGPDALAPTKSTSAVATLNGVERTLDRAQFGLTKDGTSSTLYVEAHEGGVAECPEKETPKRTLIVRGVPIGAPGDQFTKDDGVTVSLLDFAGDQITSDRPVTTATAATVTIVSFDHEASAEIEVDATFAEGTVKGRIYATYCAAMNADQ